MITMSQPFSFLPPTPGMCLISSFCWKSFPLFFSCCCCIKTCIWANTCINTQIFCNILLFEFLDEYLLLTTNWGAHPWGGYHYFSCFQHSFLACNLLSVGSAPWDIFLLFQHWRVLLRQPYFCSTSFSVISKSHNLTEAFLVFQLLSVSSSTMFPEA